MRALRKLDPPVAARLRGAIVLLAEEPRPPASRPMVGREARRLRVGDYRVIYTVQDAVLIVAVIELGQRREAFDVPVRDVEAAATESIAAAKAWTTQLRPADRRERDRPGGMA